MRYGMIMAGGSGTRLWPMSRPDRPKQFLPLVGGRTLLDVAADRLDGVVPADRRYLCIAEALRPLVHREYPAFDVDHVLGEPAARNTVNAVGFTAAVLHRTDPDAVFAVLTSDHVIEPEDRFRAALETGFALVEEDPSRFVTFAITATEPATGYGWVERGDALPAPPAGGGAPAFTVKQFVEKPPLEQAQAYLDAGTWGWNSGMFIFHAGQVLDAIGRYLPETRAGLDRIAGAWDGPDRQAVLDEVYPTLHKTSVDYGVMEPAATDPAVTICAVEMDVAWADLGSWPSYAETLEPDADGHRTNARAMHIDSSNVTVVAEDPDEFVATIGCRDLVIVRSGNRTLVCPPELAQQVREIAESTDLAGGAGSPGDGSKA